MRKETMRRVAIGLLSAVMTLSLAAVISGRQSVQPTAYASAPTALAENYSNAVYGIDFKGGGAKSTYDTTKALTSLPKTITANIRIPSGAANRTGIIFGNYAKNQYEYNFEIQSSGSGDSLVRFPKVFHVANGSASQYNFEFRSVDLAENVNYELTFVHDTKNQKAYCYVDGVLKQTIDATKNNGTNGTPEKYAKYVSDGEYTFASNKVFRVGGDYRDVGKSAENAQYFKGWISSLELYSDVRTASEIEAAFKRSADDYYVYDDNLMLAYDFTQPGEDMLKDLSGNGYNLTASKDIYSKNMQGMAFGQQDALIMDRITEVPNTFEAYLYLPEDYTGRGGVILGNYKVGSSTCFNFEIYSNGMPKLYYDYGNYAVTNVNFSGTSVALGRWVHLAITHDTVNKRATLYLDGKQEKVLENVLPGDKNAHDHPQYSSFEYQSDLPLMLGGDYRDIGKNNQNIQYFKGLLHSVAIYSDVRTEEEIKADMNGADLSDDALMGYYELDGHNARQTVMDLSENGNNFGAWVGDDVVESPTDYDYSFAVVGDTQIVAEKFPEKMNGIYEWIADNTESKKIAHVFGLGDVTNSNTDAEWAVAKSAISALDGVVPYSVVRGNHDSSEKINASLATTSYTQQFDGFYESGKIENSYRLFTAGGVKYMLITLDYGADDDVLTWAGELCETYFDHKVIVTTHAYLFRDGTTLDQGDVCPPATTGGSNNGDHIWDKLAKKYGNIFMVLSGHDPCDKIVTSQAVGDHGNVVTQMLIDAQGVDVSEGATGMVAMLYFKGNDVTVRWYSTVRDSYYKQLNQYDVDLPQHEYTAHVYQNIVSDDVLKAEATDTTHAEYYVSCSCGKLLQPTETFLHCDGRHLFDYALATEQYKASEQAEGKHAEYYYSCLCGQASTKTFRVCDGANHVFDQKVNAPQYLFAPASEGKHAKYFYSCICGEASSEWYEKCNGSHIFENVADAKFIASPASCKDKATYYKSCVCGLTSEETFEYGEPTTDHVYDRMVVSTKTLAHPATCAQKPAYYYSCACGAVGSEVFYHGLALGHSFDLEVAEDKFLATTATCVSPAAYYYSCSCGCAGEAVFEFGEIDASAHEYKAVATQKYLATPATCTEKATYYYSCECGAKSADTFSYGKVAAHDFKNKIAEDKFLAYPATCASPATYYYSCDCGKAGGETFTSGSIASAHDYDNEVAEDKFLATPATCVSPATYYYSCDCGKTGEATFTFGKPSTTHEFNQKNADEQYLARAATCVSPATYYYSCECGLRTYETFTYGETAEHDYYMRNATQKYLATTATCTDKATYYYSCECGKASDRTFEAGITAAHVYDNAVATDDNQATLATCTKKATYYYTCDCGAIGDKTFESGEVAPHTYDKLISAKTYLATPATCDQPATYYYTCACGAVGESTYQDGKALGHSFDVKHDCLDKTCVRCGYESAATASHEYDGGKITKPATTLAEGEKTYTCTKCKTTKTQSVDKLDQQSGSCATVAPVGGDLGGGGAALAVISAFALASILTLRKRRKTE